MKNKHKTKIEIKNYAIYFVLIVLIAVMLTFLFQNANKLKTTGKAFTVSIGNSCPVINPTDDPDDYTVFKMSAEANAHAANWSDQNYNTNVCSDAKGTHDCNDDNLVIRLSAAANAHIENKTENNYPIDVCFGTLICDYTTNCSTLGSEYSCLASMSSGTNAHVGDCNAYNKKICCKASGCISQGYSCCSAELNSGLPQSSYDSTCGAGEKCFSSCKSIPVVANIPDVTFNESSFNDSINLSIYITDRDTALAGITWTVKGNSSIIVKIKSNNIVNFTARPSFIGSETITFNATDIDGLSDTDEITATVSEVNSAPIITTTPLLSVKEDTLYRYDANAIDPDGDALIYSFIIKPDGMTINSSTGLIEWIPTNDHVGDNGVIINVSDGSLETNQWFTIEVNNTNDAPTISDLDDLYLVEDEAYELNVTENIDDIDNDMGILRITENSSYATVNGKIIRFSYNVPVNERVNITVTDFDDASSSQIINVYVEAVNDAPKFSDRDQTKIFKVSQGESITYRFNATDEENDPITYSTNSTLIIINPNTGVISYTAPATFLGTFYVEITASDDEGRNSSLVKSITVDNKNFAPVITSFTPEDLETELEAGYEYEFKYTVNDPDNDPLGPGWYLDGTLESTNTTFTYPPSAADIGAHILTLIISDGLLNDSITWNITVTPENHAPALISNIPNQEIEQNSKKENAFDLDSYFHDEDNDTLVYTVKGNKNISVKINLADHTVSFTPDNRWYGTEYVLFTANDGNLAAYSNNVTLIVRAIGAICGNNIKESGEECDGTDNSACGVYSCKSNCECNKPEEKCAPDWQCAEWPKCPVNGQQTRTCTDKNRCGTSEGKPAEKQGCTYTPTCLDGVQNQFEEGIDCGGPCKVCTKGLTPKRYWIWFWFLVPLILVALVAGGFVIGAHHKAEEETAIKKKNMMERAYQHKTLEEQKERELQHYVEIMLGRGFSETSIKKRLQQEGWPPITLGKIFGRIELHKKSEEKQALVSKLIKKRKEDERKKILEAFK